jgi:hypothetical protein
VKAALAEMGLIDDVLRQPLLPLAEPQRARLRTVLDSLGLLPDGTRASVPTTPATAPRTPTQPTAAAVPA